MPPARHRAAPRPRQSPPQRFHSGKAQTTSSALPTRGHRRRRRHRHRRRRLDTAAGTRLEPNRHDPGAGAEARGDASTQRQQRDQQATSRHVQSAAANNCLPATKQSATIRSLRAAPPARVNRPSRHAIYVPSRPSAGRGASQRPPPMGVRPPQRCHLCAGQAARRAAAQSPWIRYVHVTLYARRYYTSACSTRSTQHNA
jgi:hypothetical protein